MMTYARPATLHEAIGLRAGGTWLALAGGTDLFPGAGATLAGPVLDLSRIAALQGIVFDDGLRIGAATTWSAIAEAKLPPALAGLQAAARQVGARQVQNAGTIGGNLCNASPAADGVPPLLTLDAEVELVSIRGTRRMPLCDFLKGPRQTALADDELLTAVLLPEPALKGRAAFRKLGARAHLVISIAMVAARIETGGERVDKIALSVGACSAVACRLTGVEAALVGRPLRDLAAHIHLEAVAAHLAPIADVRASATYRVEAATELLRRVVGDLT